MSPGVVADRASRLAVVVAHLDEPDWRADAERLAGEQPPHTGEAVTPTYGDVARIGTGVVVALAGEGRWDEAVVQARHLRTFIARAGFRLGPIAYEAFDGLLAACTAREPEEIDDFAELIQEIFP